MVFFPLFIKFCFLKQDKPVYPIKTIFSAFVSEKWVDEKWAPASDITLLGKMELLESLPCSKLHELAGEREDRDFIEEL